MGEFWEGSLELGMNEEGGGFFKKWTSGQNSRRVGERSRWKMGGVEREGGGGGKGGKK